MKKEPLIIFENVTRYFPRFTLKDVSFEVYAGECFGILGKNGAGKTTILKLIIGEIKRNLGRINVMGMDPNIKSIEIKKNIGYVPEQENPPNFLTVSEFLHFVSKLRKIQESEIDFWIKFFELENFKNSIINDLSRGTKQKIMFAQAFLHQPQIAIIDEPLVNLDPTSSEKVVNYIKKEVKKSKTVVLSSHMVELVAKICHRALILENGQIKDIIELRKITSYEKRIKELMKFFK